MITILEAMADDGLFRRWFKDPASWSAWTVFLSALFGLPIDQAGLELITQCTGRTVQPAGAFSEAWLICGRRGGKSITLALIAVFLAVFRDWSNKLVPGERGTVMIIAADRKQARVIFRYLTSMLVETPLRDLLDGEPTQERIDLVNGISIEISTANFRSVRGYTLIACLADEIAFWDTGDGAANPDSEILAAIRPAMTTTRPDAMLLCASSPHARKGVLFDAYQRYFGKDDAPVLVWKASTRTMNPSVPQSEVDEAYERDAAKASAEYGAEFRDDVETFVSREKVEACTVKDRTELLPTLGITYVAATDPSGGSSDSMTFAIAHREGDRAVLDFVQEWVPPFSPEQVVREICDTCRRYGVNTVIGDRYAGLWPRERFQVHGVTYEVAALSRSDAYLTLLPAINSGRVELLDQSRMIAQLCALERRSARSGKDSVDHPRNGRDDVINAAALALVAAGLMSQGSAEHWIEYYRRLNIRAGLDFDDIRASGPQFGFRFNSTEPEKRLALTLPEGISSNFVQVVGRDYMVVWSDNVARIEVPKAVAIELLELSPQWREANAALVSELLRKAPV
ncbi:hypothetical protein [Bradyrhizobium sp. BR 10261]|uniref:hypothetical protein n=1 Tax=Bradyrhizobium sp. BR 10261 TaxID=2749992 RepID=UPI001C646063|nr:hypothetical protein [Bradyrhizobium sp. BR 10261]MBW7964957.1 hypothetical protein [Bradyrhizobium sp. BR 10261]